MEFCAVQLMGGLGNQLFQYAAGLAIQKQTGGKLYLYPALANKHSGIDYRILLYTGGIPQNTTLLTAHTYSQRDAFEHWSPTSPSLILCKSMTLKGYFQYLPAIASVLPKIRESVLKGIPSFPEYAEYSFLHIRRGDYLNHPTLHWTQGESYYIPAMKMIDSRKWIVLSDDIPWCRQQPWLVSSQSGPANAEKSFIFIDEPNELRALGIMASCSKGAIIANSTFSWWGAILSDCQKVVYPSKWFASSKPTLFPLSWICI
jgi:hypothetical protein